MKTALIVILISTFFSFQCSGQIQLGLRFAPNVSLNRLTDNVSTINYDLNGAGLKFSAGPTVDYFFSDNYAISSGLWYTVKRSSLTSDQMDKNTRTNIQYIQLPISVKFLTNDLPQEMQLYFQLGGTMDFKIAEKHKNYPVPPGKLYSAFDLGLLISGGTQIPIGDTTKAFMGITYNRGLINLIKDNSLNNDLKLFSNLIGIETGIIF